MFPKQDSDAKAASNKTAGDKTVTKAKEVAVWHISSGTLKYWDVENRAHLEKNVVVQSEDERMQGPVLDLYFTREPDGKSGGAGTSKISRAVGTGGVEVEQGDRRGTAERGVYTADDDNSS